MINPAALSLEAIVHDLSNLQEKPNRNERDEENLDLLKTELYIRTCDLFDEDRDED